MISEKKNGLLYFRFPHLASLPGIAHGVFSRKGGKSRGPFKSLNVTLGAGDDDACVAANRERVRRALGADKTLYFKQTHGDGIAILKKREKPDLAAMLQSPLEADAAITDVPGVFPVMQTADCQAILMADPQKRVVAAVHSGWRGSVADIAGKTVRAMKEAFGCAPENILAGVGPSLGPCCAEFVNFKDEFPPGLFKYGDASAHFDFWTLTRDQLREAGLPGRNIFAGGMCSKCETALFFSYRGEKITGRLASAIGVR
ncbi:Polyphenol oxidase [Candidatus Desulfarcum epimagneticum]|uniref:Purine nucleoside phosphorylase n=1 Tax=uncultured Desulfobacteraceae bacterium TaxID=218296 RepID=A0A484HH93_9BACT|nr:Polyphenol oxidase [uncultured Desulfobacteraceae bacterium]